MLEQTRWSTTHEIYLEVISRPHYISDKQTAFTCMLTFVGISTWLASAEKTGWRRKALSGLLHTTLVWALCLLHGLRNAFQSHCQWPLAETTTRVMRVQWYMGNLRSVKASLTLKMWKHETCPCFGATYAATCLSQGKGLFLISKTVPIHILHVFQQHGSGVSPAAKLACLQFYWEHLIQKTLSECC